jgi:hypothetical protein
MASDISSARLITSWFFQGNPFIKEIYNGFARVKCKDCAHNISQHVPANAVISVLSFTAIRVGILGISLRGCPQEDTSLVHRLRDLSHPRCLAGIRPVSSPRLLFLV